MGIRNSALTPHIEPRLEETITLPHRTQKLQKTTAPDFKKFAQGSPQPGKTMGSPDTLPLWVGIRNSVLTLHIEPRLEETSFILPHRTPKRQKTTVPDFKKFAQGSPQPGKTMSSPDTLPIMGRHP